MRYHRISFNMAIIKEVKYTEFNEGYKEHKALIYYLLKQKFI